MYIDSAGLCAFVSGNIGKGICDGDQHILGSCSSTILPCCGIFVVLVRAKDWQQC